MAIKLDYDRAKLVLEDRYSKALSYYQEGSTPPVESAIGIALGVVFGSSTQAFREVLLGCALTRLLNRNVDIRAPYSDQGENAFSARTLDETTVNPFLLDKAIPCSKGPYLAVFRRGVRFIPETRKGLRDKKGYDAFLAVISALESYNEESIVRLIDFLFLKFIALRDAADIRLMQLDRISLDQYKTLIDVLLHKPSKGLLPVILAVALFRTIKRRFDLDWVISYQGVNVADAPSGAAGDIIVKRDETVVLAIEITERVIDEARVVSTFNTKISPGGIDDYLFFYTATSPTDEARTAAKRYFGQGHDINFLPIEDWLINCLATLGPGSRRVFEEEILDLLKAETTPVKIAWNEAVKRLLV